MNSNHEIFKHRWFADPYLLEVTDKQICYLCRYNTFGRKFWLQAIYFT